MLWSWNETDDENWTHGTFNTKDEAIQDAIGCRKWIEKVYQQIIQQFMLVSVNLFR